MLQSMKIATDLRSIIHKKVYIAVLLYSWSLGGRNIHISAMNEFKLVMLKLWMLHMVHQDHLFQELGQNKFYITHIQVEEVISIQNQLQYTDQFINLIRVIHTQEITSAVYHRKFLDK